MGSIRVVLLLVTAMTGQADSQPLPVQLSTQTAFPIDGSEMPGIEPVAAQATVVPPITLPPEVQQLCGVSSPPAYNPSIRDALGPVSYANVSSGQLAYIR